MKNKIDEHNRTSLVKFKEQHREIVDQNPHFFDEDSMSHGLQTFDVRKEGDKRYLTVDRKVLHEKSELDMPTAVYELDNSNRVVKFFKHVTRKIIPFR